MARSRWLRPEFFTDERTSAVSDQALLVFAAVWVEADDGGVAPGDPALVYGRRFITRERWSEQTVAQGLDELVGAGLIRRFKRGLTRWVLVPGFAKKQSIKNPSKWRNLGDDHDAAVSEAMGEQSRGDAVQRSLIDEPVTARDGGSREMSPAHKGALQDSPCPTEYGLRNTDIGDGKKDARVSWLTPYDDAWRKQYGAALIPKGSSRGGEVARVLKGVADEVGVDESLRRFVAYLADTPPQFASVQKFARIHGTYVVRGGAGPGGTPLRFA